MSKITFQPNGHFNINGIDVHPGSDVDADLITVDVTDSPVFKWDESEKSFSINAGLRIQPITDSVTAVQILDSDGGTPIFNVDTVDERVGIGTDSPSHQLHVTGNAKIARVISNVFRDAGFENNWVIYTNVNVSTSTLVIGNGTVRPMRFNLHVDGKAFLGTGSGTPNARFHIQGSSDIVQNIVQAHSTQVVNNLVEFQDSDGNVDSKISADRGAAFGAFDDGNYTEMEADGTVVFVGAATVFKDINMGAAVLTRPAVSQPDEVNFVDEAGADTGIASLGFAVGEKVSGNFELEHDYKEGTDLVFHVHWQGVAAPSGTDKVKWQLTYTVSQSDTTLNATTPIVIETDFDTQYEFMASAFPAITGTDFNIEDQFLFTLERIAASADEYAGDGIVATVGIHYEIDTVGSRQVLVK